MKTQNNTKLMIPMKYFDMFTYRMCGLNFKEISVRTEYSYDHVRHVFCRGGVLFDYWRQWADDFKRDAIETALDIEYSHLVDIVLTNIIAAKDTDTMVGVAARKLIFDRVFGRSEPAKGSQKEQKQFTFTDWIKEQTLKAKEEDRLLGISESDSQ